MRMKIVGVEWFMIRQSDIFADIDDLRESRSGDF